MGFNLDNYETVKDRIARFYADHIDGSIVTELVNNPESLIEFASFKASAFVGGRLIATGYAMEQKGQGVNKDAWVENAETSAIGRALANMDYCGTLRPSREEMSKVGNTKDHDIDYYRLAIISAKDEPELRKFYGEATKIFGLNDSLTSMKDQRKKELGL